jgi:hypothetical protein
VSSGHEPVELYGIIEIATALGVDRRKVAVWHGRGKLPPADFRASGRPFWKPETITPWIATQAEALATAPEPADAVDKRPAAVQVSGPTLASSPSASEPSSQARRLAPGATALPRSPAQRRRAPAPVQDQEPEGMGGGDPYELARSSHGWTLTYRGEPIGTVRATWSATGRSKRWQAYSPSGTRLDARAYPTVRAAAVRVAQAHRHATDPHR